MFSFHKLNLITKPRLLFIIRDILHQLYTEAIVI